MYMEQQRVGLCTIDCIAKTGHIIAGISGKAQKHYCRECGRQHGEQKTDEYGRRGILCSVGRSALSSYVKASSVSCGFPQRER